MYGRTLRGNFLTLISSSVVVGAAVADYVTIVRGKGAVSGKLRQLRCKVQHRTFIHREKTAFGSGQEFNRHMVDFFKMPAVADFREFLQGQIRFEIPPVE